MRHDNFCDRLISRMTCGSKRKEPSVSDGGKIERSGVPKAAKAFCLWPASLGYRANFCTTGSRRAHGPEGLNRFPFSHKGREEFLITAVSLLLSIDCRGRLLTYCCRLHIGIRFV